MIRKVSGDNVTHLKYLSSVLLFFCIVTEHNANALELPKKGPFDNRVRFIDYEPADVVQLIGHYGFSTHIQFSASERVKQIAMGDKDAWEVAPVNNHIFIKPKGKKAATNMTVVTSHRVYNFELSAHWPHSQRTHDMVFQLNFRYPKEIAARKKHEAEADELRSRLKQPDNNFPTNWNYWAKGSEEVTPSEAFDNNQFTFLTFDNNAEMPAIYVVNPDGSESLVNTHIDEGNPDVIVVHRIARQFVMRKGNSVACIFNQSYTPRGVTNHKKTMISGVERVVKGDK